MPAMLAELLGLPAADPRPRGHRRRTDRRASSARPTRATATSPPSLPAVVSVGEKINEPRYPSFKGIMAAKKKPVDDARARRPGHRRRRGRPRPSALAQVVDAAPAQAAARGRQKVDRRGRRRHEDRRVPRRARSSSERRREHMAEVLVLVDHARRRDQEGHLRAAHRGPRAWASRRPSSSAPPGTAGQARRGARGARRREGLRRRVRRRRRLPVTPQVDALAALVERVVPAGRAHRGRRRRQGGRRPPGRAAPDSGWLNDVVEVDGRARRAPRTRSSVARSRVQSHGDHRHPGDLVAAGLDRGRAGRRRAAREETVERPGGRRGEVGARCPTARRSSAATAPS